MRSRFDCLIAGSIAKFCFIDREGIAVEKHWEEGKQFHP
jgi:hypothetical protein